MIWNPYTYKETVIFDPITEKIYTQEQAEKLSQEIKHRLLNKPVKFGAWVMTMEEVREVLKNREDLK